MHSGKKKERNNKYSFGFRLVSFGFVWFRLAPKREFREIFGLVYSFYSTKNQRLYQIPPNMMNLQFMVMVMYEESNI